jgi:hypothetical protein
MTIQEQIQKLKKEHSLPHPLLHGDIMSGLRLKCSFGQPGIPPKEFVNLGLQIPPELVEFWQNASNAMLFEDVDYGQWGLQIFPYSEVEVNTKLAQKRRSKQFRPGDLVVGQFLGDLDQLIVRCDASASDFGSVVIALQIYPREEWPTVAINFREFLNKYADANGDMYWEKSIRKDVL